MTTYEIVFHDVDGDPIKTQTVKKNQNLDDIVEFVKCRFGTTMKGKVVDSISLVELEHGDVVAFVEIERPVA